LGILVLLTQPLNQLPKNYQEQLHPHQDLPFRPSSLRFVPCRWDGSAPCTTTPTTPPSIHCLPPAPTLPRRALVLLHIYGLTWQAHLLMPCSLAERATPAHRPPFPMLPPSLDLTCTPTTLSLCHRIGSALARLQAKSSRNGHDSHDEDNEEFKPGSIAGNDDSAPRDSRRETVCKQRIESKQHRRDELREGYSRLQESLPPLNQKASKVSLLGRGSLTPSAKIFNSGFF
jgi:hypothetical protein